MFGGQAKQALLEEAETRISEFFMARIGGASSPGRGRDQNILADCKDAAVQTWRHVFFFKALGKAPGAHSPGTAPMTNAMKIKTICSASCSEFVLC